MRQGEGAARRAADARRAAADCHRGLKNLLIAGRVAEAERGLAEVLRTTPFDADALALAARAAGMRGDRSRELELAGRAVEAAPVMGEHLALLARVLARAQDPVAADAAIRSAIGAGDLSEIALDELATACRLMGRFDDAVDLLLRAITEGSANVAVLFNLGNNLKFLGRFEEARRAYARCIEVAPGFHKAHAAIAALGGGDTDAADLDRIEALLDGEADPEARIHLRHAAAKRCDALGLFDRAWDHLAFGKRQLTSALGVDPRVALPAMDTLCDRLRRESAPTEGVDGAGPILIVGMPRTGTTVLDRMLSNHRQVTSIGESMYFVQLVKAAARSASPALLDARMIAALDDPAGLVAVGDRYRHRHSAALPQGTRFLDKFHLNVMLAPHIVRAMPDARLLCVIRDPLDTIVGNFRQLFEIGSDAYRYTLDIIAAAEFYVRFRRLAELMERLAPRQFRTIRYEDVIRDPEGQARLAVEFCGLPEQDGCERIELNEAPVATASAVQVRDPVDARYVGRWRRYERHLGEASNVLRRAGLLPG